jgi:hypothetical protein
MVQTIPFDNLVSSHAQQLIKAAIPYLPMNQQRVLCVYVKAQELLNTMHLISNEEDSMLIACSTGENNPSDIISAIRECCTKKEAEFLDNFLQMKKMMALYKEMMDNTEEGNTQELFKKFLSPEQAQMMSAFEMMNSQEV